MCILLTSNQHSRGLEFQVKTQDSKLKGTWTTNKNPRTEVDPSQTLKTKKQRKQENKKNERKANKKEKNSSRKPQAAKTTRENQATKSNNNHGSRTLLTWVVHQELSKPCFVLLGFLKGFVGIYKPCFVFWFSRGCCWDL